MVLAGSEAQLEGLFGETRSRVEWEWSVHSDQPHRTTTPHINQQPLHRSVLDSRQDIDGI